MYPEVHFTKEATLRWSGVEAKAPQAPQWLTVISSSLPTKGSASTTMGPLRAVTEPVQAWGNLHNLIGGSQVITAVLHTTRKSHAVPPSHKAV